MVKKYHSNPREAQWITVTHVFTYLQKTSDMLVYGYDDLVPVGYGDPDFQADMEIQISSYDSAMDTEYVAASDAAKEAVWLKKFLLELEIVSVVSFSFALKLITLKILHNQRTHQSQKGKHIKCRYYLVRELVQYGDVMVSKIGPK
ncbi:hypothetical protein RJ639_017843 [Escallonia herrerae]|uniref:Uncharacterized protein n=1 Tax=Escallonia herrerae TaxID=1293975 RepID=A0AA89AKY7_9ASTE|nr:hypothetical protein RJ639_017843 [Escallonia herrerae]